LVDRLETLEGEFDGEMPAEAGPPRQIEQSPPETTPTSEQIREQSTARESSADGGGQAGDDRAGDEESDDEDADEEEAETAPAEPPPPEPSAMDVGGEAETASEQSTESPEPAASDETTIDDPGDAETRWERLVEWLREHYGTTGVKFEWAHPRSFEDGTIELGCNREHYSFFQRDDHMTDIEEAAADLFGGDWEASIAPWDEGEEDDQETLAQQREAEYQERRENLREEVRGNSVVQQAQELFNLGDEDVRIDVELDE
ncbi:MAG: hypothetical protein ABEN55_19105, partial [Bradymonadaceae bacterium]